MSMPMPPWPPRLARSRMWPTLAATSKPGPRYFWMVLALAGDSTITRLRPEAPGAGAAAAGFLRGVLATGASPATFLGARLAGLVFLLAPGAAAASLAFFRAGMRRLLCEDAVKVCGRQLKFIEGSQDPDQIPFPFCQIGRTSCPL